MVYRMSIRYRFPLSNAKDNAPNACDNENAEYPKKAKPNTAKPKIRSCQFIIRSYRQITHTLVKSPQYNILQHLSCT